MIVCNYINTSTVCIYKSPKIFNLFLLSLRLHYFGGDHGGRVATLSSPTSDVGPVPSGKAGSCLPLVGSLQYKTLTNCMYWFALPFQLPIVI